MKEETDKIDRKKPRERKEKIDKTDGKERRSQLLDRQLWAQRKSVREWTALPLEDIWLYPETGIIPGQTRLS